MNLQESTQKKMVLIPAAELRGKANSKKEIFNLLCVECDAYLPSYETLTIYFLKDLISGKKKCK